MTEHIFLTFMGLCAGFAAAAGTFAFIIVIGVVPRIIGKSNTAKNLLQYENAIIAGGIAGCILSVFTQMRLPIGRIFLYIFGFCSGIYVGSLSVALAEILNTFPICFRRLRLKKGMYWVLFSMALGKVCGSLYYFLVCQQ